MELDQDNLHIFGFTDAEAKAVLALVEKGPLRVSTLGRTADIPRTTAYSVLKRLKKRGFVKRIAKGVHRERWRIARLPQLKKRVREALETFERDDTSPAPRQTLGSVSVPDIDIAVFRGRDEVLKVYAQMVKLHQAERVYAVQGNRSADRAIQMIGKEYLFSLHEQFKKRGVILEGINGEHVQNLFRALSAEELESHFGRSIISTLVPDKDMDFDMDLLVMRDAVLFIEIESETVIVIRHHGIVRLVRSLVQMAQAFGHAFNMNEFLREIIDIRTKRKQEQS